jgi:predicted CXXCH cytochrome family protein
MRPGLRAVVLLISCIMALLLFSSNAFAADLDCLTCHRALTKGSVLHAAVSMGCTTCHTSIDTKNVPHKKSGTVARGLSAEQPDLCYGCHAKEAFEKKVVHAALGMGCTSCHNPHSSNTAKLLLSEAPDLCFTCHDKALFSKKTTHSPVAGGMCLTCHVPHASDEVALLANKPYDLCVTCHSEIVGKPHAVSGFSSASHPLGAKKTGKRKAKRDDSSGTTKTLMDPARPGRAFYCGSCHEPHSTDSPRLFRFNAKSAMGLCSNCHKM